MLPARKERQRSGIERAPQRDFPRHRAFIRKHTCVVTLGIVHDDCDGPIECAHVRTAANAGTGLRPHDGFTLSLCRKHHAESHRLGDRSFEAKYKISLADIAREFALASPVDEVREFARTAMGRSF